MYKAIFVFVAPQGVTSTLVFSEYRDVLEAEIKAASANVPGHLYFTVIRLYEYVK